ncbi:hypothetical protein Tco_0288822, partial [Tanacetum coccineum]
MTLVVAIPTVLVLVLVLVLVPTILIVGLAVVLYGRKTGWSDLVCHRWRTVTQLCSTAFTGAGAGTGDVCLSRSRALTIDSLT